MYLCKVVIAPCGSCGARTDHAYHREIINYLARCFLMLCVCGYKEMAMSALMYELFM